MPGVNNKKYPLRSVLIIDDDPAVLNTLKITLHSSGYENVMTCGDSRQALNILNKTGVEIILLDLIMPHIRGEDLLNQIMAICPFIRVIVISGVNDISCAVECIKRGAFDYIVKPVERDKLLNSVSMAVRSFELLMENSELKDKLFSDFSTIHEAFSDIVTNNHLMKSIFKYCEAIAHSSQPVLITGETGTGKELVARALYKLYNLSGKFVSVHIAGLDDNMFSDTLFGHFKGSYRRASTFREGLLKSAENGVLFLDEIGDLGLQSQTKILRLLQDREYSPLGSDLTKRSNARLILATNKELPSMMSSGEFRKDLFYRLSAHQIKLPPLRERLDDIPLLLNTFIKESSKDVGKKAPTYHPDLITLLKSFHFPGNIRELQAMVYNAINSHKSHMLSVKSFSEYIDYSLQGHRVRRGSKAPSNDDEYQELVSQLQVIPSLKTINGIIIAEALKRSNGNQRTASILLGISPQALSKRLKKQTKINRIT